MTSTPPPSDDGSGYATAWSFSAKDGAAAAPAAAKAPRRPFWPDLDPPSDKLLWLAGLFAVLLIAVVVNAALHSDGNPLNPVAEAAQRTQRVPGMRLAMEYRYTGAELGAPVVGHGRGSYDARSGRSRMTISIGVPGRSFLSMRAVGDDRTVFLSSSTLAPVLPPGKSWMAMQPLLGHSAETAFGQNGNAASSLEMLRTVGDGVEEEGEATIRGHLTHHYSGEIELDRVVGLMRERGDAGLATQFEQIAERSPATIPFEVWIDENGLTRRLRLVQQLPVAAGKPALTMDMKMEMFDFGTRPKVVLPPKHLVFDTTPMLRAELGLLNGDSLASVTRPSRRVPMTAAAFRRRGNAICRTVVARGKALAHDASGFSDAFRRLEESGASAEEKFPLLQRYTHTTYRAAQRLEVEMLRRLARLSPPRAELARFTRLLRIGAVGAERRLAEIVALEAGNMAVAREISKELDAHSSDGDATARRFGWSTCLGDHDGGQSDASTA